MNNDVTLTDAQWELVVELLQRERRELPSDIHHTQTPSMRDGLKQRLKEIDALLARLGQPVGA